MKSGQGVQAGTEGKNHGGMLLTGLLFGSCSSGFLIAQVYLPRNDAAHSGQGRSSTSRPSFTDIPIGHCELSGPWVETSSDACGLYQVNNGSKPGRLWTGFQVLGVSEVWQGGVA